MTRWEANGQEHHGSGAALDSAHSDLLFEYAALSFRDEDDVRFRYQLVGYDKQWSAPRKERSVRYTNLAPGSYTFKLSAANGDGVWSELPATVSFSIHPPYWATWWFRVALGLLLAGGGYGSYRLRIGVVRRRNEELERLVKDFGDGMTWIERSIWVLEDHLDALAEFHWSCIYADGQIEVFKFYLTAFCGQEARNGTHNG